METRGYRNNNPLNIKKGENWKGLALSQTDPVFCQFDSVCYGYRAAFKILRQYFIHHGIDTIRQIVHRWSPDGEDKERLYIDAVSKWTGIEPDKTLFFSDRDSIISIVAAMSRFENGREPFMPDIVSGYAMADGYLYD